MRILLTNDDGINAPGLQAMEAIAAELAGPEGEVWIVAPAFEQSGVGHMISYTHPTLIAELGPRRFAAEGSPADCVIAGLFELMPQKPDLVLSGVNAGNNAAENAVYSGTVGGAMEGALHGIPAMALSQYFGPATAGLADRFEVSRAFGAETVRRLLAARLDNPSPYQLFYNINFPPCGVDDVKGLTVAPQGMRLNTGFTAKSHRSPSGRNFIWVHGGNQHGGSTPGSDAQACLDGHITVTPMRADLTAHDALDGLATALEDRGRV